MLSLTLPSGAAALLSSVRPCPEPQASQGTCPSNSLIGEATALAGLGPDPYTVTGGRVYITGPYQGAPYGLSIVTPAVAGPFNLGNVVVRSKIEVNPHTAQVTISSPLPTIVQGVGMESSGIPLALKQVHVIVYRPNFEYNPTSCNPLGLQASLTGAQGATSSTTVPFQVAGCQNLPFNPGVNASTEGQTSKAQGASLALKFTSHAGKRTSPRRSSRSLPPSPPGSPPSKKPASPASSKPTPPTVPKARCIGTATVHTPVLKNPLTGPIYLVSHGNAAWPDAELVLQGEGITIILDGQTAIKKGITTSSFQTVPDAPFESVQATLPEGPHSALTTNLPLKEHYNLCGQHLIIPTALTGQNGTSLTDNVKVTVQGCSAVKTSKTKKPSKLALALKACRRQYKRAHNKRAACETRARKPYTAKKTARKNSNTQA